MRSFKQAAELLPEKVRNELLSLPEDIMPSVREIRLRAQMPLVLTLGNTPVYIRRHKAVSVFDGDCFSLTGRELFECVQSMCRYSLHTFSESIANGYIPLAGGHRAGICGSASVRGGEVVSVRDYTSVNIRIARDVPGAAGELTRLLGRECTGILIAGPPLSGKTTLLRDLCRLYSAGVTGKPLRVAAVDERAELFGDVSHGEGFFPGYNTDVLSGYPKAYAIELALRTLSPEVTVFDEIGGRGEADAVISGLNSGVSFTASAHAGSIKELLSRPQARALLECGAFSKIVLLGHEKPCGITGIYNVDEVT